ncbi:Radial spoke head protein 4 A [Entophlyctis sp. JEL0112]|nr:Radial spoke head protein 4 A [Entophlyctis sp. JEL0112]
MEEESTATNNAPEPSEGGGEVQLEQTSASDANAAAVAESNEAPETTDPAENAPAPAPAEPAALSSTPPSAGAGRVSAAVQPRDSSSAASAGAAAAAPGDASPPTPPAARDSDASAPQLPRASVAPAPADPDAAPPAATARATARASISDPVPAPPSDGPARASTTVRASVARASVSTAAAAGDVAAATAVHEVTPISEIPEGAAAVSTPDDVIATAAAAATLEASTTPHLKRKDVYFKPEVDLPDSVELQLARAFLLETSEKSNMNVYDHLTLTVMRVLETRPRNAVDIFESISSEVKRSKFNTVDPASSAFRPAYDPAPGIKLAKLQMKLFDQPPQDEVPDEGLGEIPDIMDLSHLWEWAGVSFGADETFKLFLSLRKLVADKPLKSVRLWGKIYGTHADYIVTEGELKDGATDDDADAANGLPGDAIDDGDANPEDGAAAAAAENDAETADAAAAAAAASADPSSDSPAPEAAVDADPALPKPKVRVVPPLPREERIGVNRYVYYVCSYRAYPGGPWTRLPDVIPEKLQISRKIRKYFSGDLKAQIISYPKFEGNEAQYLRCQIARISSATVASPAGYYMFDPEDEGNEEEGHQPTIIINPEHEGLPNDALLSLSNWVHHVPYILPQGRTSWVNPYASLAKADGDDDGGGGSDNEDENDDENAGDKEDNPADSAEPETGPPLLTPLANDEDPVDNGAAGPAWVARACATLAPAKFTPIVLRSTRWPGALVVAYNDKFANLYVGDGHGDVGPGLALPDGSLLPPVLPDISKEFVLVEKVDNPDDPDTPILKETGLVEQKDPTVEEETAFEEAKKAKEEEEKEAAEEGEEEEAAEEEEN